MSNAQNLIITKPRKTSCWFSVSGSAN